MKKRHDFYYKKAKQENYAARSVYKLEEAIQKYAFITPHDRVLDVGCAPGSWSSYLLRKTIVSGSIVGVDILACEITDRRFTFLQGDIATLSFDGIDTPFDVVISDAMPNTTMDKETNHYQSIGLADAILYRVRDVLKEGGHFFIKLYDGGDFPRFKNDLAKQFSSVRVFKPKSSRNESRELFLFAKERKA